MSHFLLHVETATKVCSVALSLNGRQVAIKETNSDQYIHGESLNLFIEEVLCDAKIEIQDLNAVSISSGPGSYTGLRIGVSSVKGLCYGLGIPLISIPTLDALYFLAREKYTSESICVMLDARRMEVYSQIWGNDGAILKSLSADVLDENTYNEFDSFVCVGDGAEKMRDIWNPRSIHFDSSLIPSAAGQIKLAYNKFLVNDFVDVADFVPHYLKEFQSTGQSK
ncbi:MAG: tRNA (adenosine(37)-N6)-threonylcarbamoyltransferase complex dimerization subunit type 1 TsaB [Crocinitomicaceae bacterium]|jgi:tRNA threonylcarbamoyladenosine biosynthesis protein TsaB